MFIRGAWTEMIFRIGCFRNPKCASDGKPVSCGVDVNLSEDELKLPVDDLLARVFKPALSTLLEHINREKV